MDSERARNGRDREVSNGEAFLLLEQSTGWLTKVRRISTIMFEDDEFQFEDDEFQWDVKKAAENFRKHSVRFEETRMAFDDPFCITMPDGRTNYGEDRFNLLGKAGGREETPILMVTYAFRENKTRIISAREAEPNEKRKYRNSQGGDSSWKELLDGAHRIKRKKG